MSLKTIRLETMSEDELAFLTQKREKESRSFYFGLKIMTTICIGMPFLVAYLVSIDERQQVSFWEAYLYALIMMVIIFCIVVSASYIRKLFFLDQDIKHHQKIIETVEITERKFMPHNKTFHFYIDSQLKLSIEVKQEDFLRLLEGDEICIEYSQYSKEYFGYF